jgi:hypothetical protein
MQDKDKKANAQKAKSPPGKGSVGKDKLAKLKKALHKTRLSKDLREKILAQLPSLEEQERLYRELQEKGGLSSRQLLKSLGLEVQPQS